METNPFKIMDLINELWHQEFKCGMEPPAVDRIDFSQRELDRFFWFHAERQSQIERLAYDCDYDVVMVLAHG